MRKSQQKSWTQFWNLTKLLGGFLKCRFFFAALHFSSSSPPKCVTMRNNCCKDRVHYGSAPHSEHYWQLSFTQWVVVVFWNHHKGVSTPPCCFFPLRSSSSSQERHSHPHHPSPEKYCSLEISPSYLIRETIYQNLLWHFHPPPPRHSPCRFLTGLSWFYILRN